MQWMILNAFEANLFPIEQWSRDFCDITKDMCTVFAEYDMCKDQLTNYPGLTLKIKKRAIANPASKGRGEGEVDLGTSYWHIMGAEVKGTVAAQSIVGPESLEVL